MPRFSATARCRVDLAGGTLDIWPLGVLHPGAVTVNVAVDLPVRVTLGERAAGWSVVQGEEQVSAPTLAALRAEPGGALAAEVLAHAGARPCSVTIASASPRGAGLGASSALTVALLAAAELEAGGRLSLGADERAALARDLEARLMQLPTGRQDHFPAQLGGALALEHRAGGERAVPIAVDLAAMGERLLLAYTGQSHFSAANNWQVVRRRLDGDDDVVRRLDAIRDAALALRDALGRGDWEEVGAGMAADWRARRGLAPAISTAEIERLLETASAHGAWGGKACGAGGGGCVAVLAPPERRAAIAAAWRQAGARVLAAAPTARGLETGVEDP